MFKILKIQERLFERYEPVRTKKIYICITASLKRKFNVFSIKYFLEDSQGLLNKIYLIIEVESLHFLYHC